MKTYAIGLRLDNGRFVYLASVLLNSLIWSNNIDDAIQVDYGSIDVIKCIFSSLGDPDLIIATTI